VEYTSIMCIILLQVTISDRHGTSTGHHVLSRKSLCSCELRCIDQHYLDRLVVRGYTQVNGVWCYQRCITILVPVLHSRMCSDKPWKGTPHAWRPGLAYRAASAFSPTPKRSEPDHTIRSSSHNTRGIKSQQIPCHVTAHPHYEKIGSS
jgi:hypothetical protein